MECRRDQRDSEETLVPKFEHEDVHIRSPPPAPASQRQQQLSACMLSQFSALRDTAASSQARYRPHCTLGVLLVTPLRMVTLCMFSHSLLTHSACDRGPISHPPTSPVLPGLCLPWYNPNNSPISNTPPTHPGLVLICSGQGSAGTRASNEGSRRINEYFTIREKAG